MNNVRSRRSTTRTRWPGVSLALERARQRSPSTCTSPSSPSQLKHLRLAADQRGVADDHRAPVRPHDGGERDGEKRRR